MERPGGELFRHRQGGVRDTNVGPRGSTGSRHRCGDNRQPGVKGEWFDSQNRRLQRQLVRALDCLCQMRLNSGEPALAVESAIEAVGLGPYREHTYQLLMQAYATDGNKAKALDVYHDLRKDLGTEPSAKTQALYRQLRD